MASDTNIKAFARKVHILGQSGGRDLLLSAKEAKDLQYEIFSLLLELNALKTNSTQAPGSVQLNLDAGKF